jgi:hypothetical protein
MLSQRRLLPPVDISKIKPHPQVMKLMIDNDKSPVNAIPGDLRDRLFAIYLQHADGVTERKGKAWVQKRGSNWS